MLRTSIPGFFHIEFYDSGPTNKHAEQMVCALRCALPVAAEILPRMFHALSWRSAARLSFCQCSSARYLLAATLVPWTVRPTGHIMAIDFASTIEMPTDFCNLSVRRCVRLLDSQAPSVVRRHETVASHRLAASVPATRGCLRRCPRSNCVCNLRGRSEIFHHRFQELGSPCGTPR